MLSNYANISADKCWSCGKTIVWIKTFIFTHWMNLCFHHYNKRKNLGKYKALLKINIKNFAFVLIKIDPSLYFVVIKFLYILIRILNVQINNF